jgi:lipopolysaccharide transport system permease protein
VGAVSKSVNALPLEAQPSLSPCADNGESRGATEEGEPLVFSEAPPAWRVVDLRELWKYRGLLLILAIRDLKVRYRQTLVGVAWAVLQPLTTMGIFLVLFGLLGRRPATEGTSYALVILCGLLPWQLFASTLTQATSSLTANQDLIGKVYFPRILLPMAVLLNALVDFAIAFLLLGAMLLGCEVAPSWQVAFVPGFILLCLLTALAGGIWLSALNAMYRDVGFVVPFLLQVGFFASPVVYEIGALIPERWQPLYSLNPLAGVLEGFRWALLGHTPPPVLPILVSLAGDGILLVTGLAYFRRIERFLADRI